MTSTSPPIRPTRHRSGFSTSHPSNPLKSPSSSNRFPLFPLPVLNPVPVRGGSAGGLSSPSIRLGTGFLAPMFGGGAILLLGAGSGSSRYLCGGGVAPELLPLLKSEGLGLTGGGPGLRRTWGAGLLFIGSGGPGSEDVTGGRLRFGRMGRERVDAFDALRRKSLTGSWAPSM